MSKMVDFSTRYRLRIQTRRALSLRTSSVSSRLMRRVRTRALLASQRPLKKCNICPQVAVKTSLRSCSPSTTMLATWTSRARGHLITCSRHLVYHRTRAVSRMSTSLTLGSALKIPMFVALCRRVAAVRLRAHCRLARLTQPHQ